MNSVSAALLAGGKSRRMGRDKCLVEVNGIPLWRRQTEPLSELTSDLLVVAPTLPAWCPPHVRWVEDVVKNQGPLGGLATALAAASHACVVVLAVDLPAMTAKYLNTLITESTADCGAVPEIDDIFQPLSAVYPRSALVAAKAQLNEPDKSLQRLIRHLIAEGKMRPVPVSAENLPLFRNLNSPLD